MYISRERERERKWASERLLLCCLLGLLWIWGFFWAEASFEVLPRLNKIKFDSGVVDELLFLDMPQEHRLPSGILLLEYAKVTQQTVYDHLRVVREGQLRIKFTPDLKVQQKSPSLNFYKESHQNWNLIIGFSCSSDLVMGVLCQTPWRAPPSETCSSPGIMVGLRFLKGSLDNWNIIKILVFLWFLL